MKKGNWMPFVSVLALVVAVVALVMVLSSGTTGQAVYSSTIGNVNVVSSPSGANVYVDGALRGITPTTVTGLTGQSHAVKISKTGYYPYSTYVYIYAGQTADLTVDLTVNATNK